MGTPEQGDIIYVTPPVADERSRIADEANQEIREQWARQAPQPLEAKADDDGTYLEYWDDRDAPWDVLVINDKPLPGVWEIESAPRRLHLDRKKTKGKDGARLTDLGTKETVVTARGQLQALADWHELQRRLEVLNPRGKSRARTPLHIYHPALALMGLTRVYLEEIRAPRVRGGILELGLQLREWVPTPKPTNTDPQGLTDQEHAKAQFLANMLVTPGDDLYQYGVHMPPKWRSEYEAQEQAKQDAAAGQGQQRKKLPQEEQTAPSREAVNPQEYKLGKLYDLH